MGTAHVPHSVGLFRVSVLFPALVYWGHEQQSQVGEQGWCQSPRCWQLVSILFLFLSPALPAAEAFSVAGPSTMPLELWPAREYRGALCAAAGGLGGGEDGQVPPNPGACKELLFFPSGFSRFLKL